MDIWKLNDRLNIVGCTFTDLSMYSDICIALLVLDKEGFQIQIRETF